MRKPLSSYTKYLVIGKHPDFGQVRIECKDWRYLDTITEIEGNVWGIYSQTVFRPEARHLVGTIELSPFITLGRKRSTS